MRPVHAKTPLTATVLAAVVALLLGLLPGSAHATPEVPATEGSIPGQLLVKFVPGSASSDRAAAIRSVGATVKDTIPQLGVAVLRVDAARSPRALEALRRNPNVRYAEPDGLMTLEAEAVSANDPDFTRQWGLSHTRTTSAWSISKGSSQIRIAILDTGVNPVGDLQAKLLPGRNVVSGNADVTDANGHGTRAAGVAAAATDNAVDVAGYCWACAILPVKVTDSSSISWSSSASGIVWAADNGAHVISMSYGGSTASATVHDAVKYAHAKGALLVGAAGNDGSTVQTYPAAFPEVLAVAGTDQRDVLYTWSNRGSWVDVSAPGQNRTTNRDGGTILFGGTSSATPAAAGIAGLVLAHPAKPTTAQVRTALQSSAVPFGSDVRYGRLDALGALNHLGGTTPPPPPAPASPNVAITAPANGATVSGTITVSGTASSNDAATITGVDVTIGGQTLVATGTTSWSYTLDTASLPAGTNRITATARTSSGTATSTHIDVVVSHPAPDPEPEPEPSAPSLDVTTSKVKGRNVADLRWDGSIGSPATILRDGNAIATVRNGTTYRDDTRTQGQVVVTYQVCATTCTARVTVSSW